MSHSNLIIFVITPLILSIGVVSLSFDDAPWPIVPEESSDAEKEEAPVLPEWLEDQAIDVEEAIKEILEKRNN